MGTSHAAATLCGQGGICIVVYKAVEHVIIEQIRMEVFGETNNQHVDECLKANIAAKALGKTLPCNDKFLTTIEPFVQTQRIEAITNQRRVDILRSKSMGTNATMNAAEEAEAILMDEATARTSSESSNEENYKGRKSKQTCHRTCSCTCRNR